MTLPTYQEAIDEMTSLFWLAWDAGTTAIVGYKPVIYWDGQERKEIPPTDQFYCEFKIKAVKESQATLQGDLDAGGSRRYNNKGLIMVDIYSPISQANHVALLGELSVLVRNAYRGNSTASGIVFYNATIKSLMASDSFYNNLVLIEYEYDTIG